MVDNINTQNNGDDPSVKPKNNKKYRQMIEIYMSLLVKGTNMWPVTGTIMWLVIGIDIWLVTDTNMWLDRGTHMWLVTVTNICGLSQTQTRGCLSLAYICSLSQVLFFYHRHEHVTVYIALPPLNCWMEIVVFILIIWKQKSRNKKYFKNLVHLRDQ